MCQPGRDDDGKVYTSAFVPASGPGYWHAGFEATSSDRFIEIDLAVALNGEPVSRFWPYAIKTDGRRFSFNFRDTAEKVFEGSGSEIKLTCTLYYGSAGK